MLYPTRVVFEDNQRAAQLQIINSGTETIVYRLSLVNRRMDETGRFLAIDEPAPGEKFADDMVRFSPRQISLPAGAKQTVRLMVRKPAGLATGEYRSHLLIAQQPTANLELPDEEPEKNIGVKIDTLIGASIPVIVRHGQLTADVALTNLRLERLPTAQPVLALHIERSGSRSVYGDLTVTFTPNGKEERVIARANGVAVYTPNAVRHARIVLDNLSETVFPSGMLTDGTLRVSFQEPAETKGQIHSEATLSVP